MDLTELTLKFVPESEEEKKLLASWEKNTVIVIYSGDIHSQLDKILLSTLEEKGQGEDIILFATTYGGDPDAAYRTARLLQCKYKSFSLAVMGECKSAGTLLALGANEIIMSYEGELGPLDVQVFRPDEFLQRTSGLVISQALSFLSERALDAFEKIFLTIRGKSGGIITTTTASEIASSIVTGLYAPITEKIDPMIIGEMQRSMDIAIQYGIRLGAKQEIVEHLAKNYPSHSFVIDFEEAKDLFQNVRVPNEIEEIIITNIMNSLTNEYNLNFLKYPAPEGFIGIVRVTEECIGGTNENSGFLDKKANKKHAKRTNGARKPSKEIGEKAA